MPDISELKPFTPIKVEDVRTPPGPLPELGSLTPVRPVLPAPTPPGRVLTDERKSDRK